MKKVFVFFAAFFAANLVLAQWEPDVRLTNDPANSNTSYNNARNIAVSGDTLHIVWQDNRDGNDEIYYKRSIDGGLTWETDKRLTNDSQNSWEPTIAVSGSVVHVVWVDDRVWGVTNIFYKKSTDGGTTWGEDTRLTPDTVCQWAPCLAISGSFLHLVWYDDRNDPSGGCGGWYPDIYYQRSTDGGLTWGSDTRLTEKAPGAWFWSGYPCIAVSGSVVHVVWEDDRGGNGNIFYKRSMDGGLTWGSDIQLTNDPADSWDPCIALSDSILHIVWLDNRNGSNNDEIYYKRSTDGGLSWGTDIRLSNASGASEYPSVAVSGSMVHVVWEDNHDMGNNEIYYKQSVDAGLSWGGSNTRLTNASGNSNLAHIALSDSVVNVVWQDNRDGNDDIYYKRNPTGNVPVGIGNDLASNTGQQIRIWPNPASNMIHINFNNDSDLTACKGNEKTILTIRNIYGEQLVREPIINGESTVDVSTLQNGIYFSEIKTGNNQAINTKLIISK
jgi:hypothetical protein